MPTNSPRRARRWIPLLVPAGLAFLIVIAVTISFPVARTLIMAIHAALFAPTD